MKKFYLLLLCACFTLTLIAQPTLQYPQNAPQIGDVTEINFVATNGLSTGATGPDVNWDYSELSTLYGGQITAIDPAQAPAGNEFPSANVALNMGDTIFTYVLTNTEGYYYLGSQSTTGTFPSLLIYSDSRTFLKFPFTYQNTYFDTYKGVVTTSMADVIVTAESEMEADAYGTLILPNGTYTNVLRTLTVDTEIDSVFVGGFYVKDFNIVRSQYSWFAANSKSPLFSIEILENTYYGVTDTVAYYSSVVTAISDHPDEIVSRLRVFPNPAISHLNIHLDQFYRNANLLISDIYGRAVEEVEVSSDKIQINTSSYASGLYLVTLKENNRIIDQKKFEVGR